jgi:hypothetical protein
MPPVFRNFARKGGQPVGLRVRTQPGNAVISAIVNGRQRAPRPGTLEPPFSVGFDDGALEHGIAAWIPRSGWEYDVHVTSNVLVQNAAIELITGTNIQRVQAANAGPGVLALLRLSVF